MNTHKEDILFKSIKSPNKTHKSLVFFSFLSNQTRLHITKAGEKNKKKIKLQNQQKFQIGHNQDIRKTNLQAFIHQI